jgi:hypothetical protein
VKVRVEYKYTVIHYKGQIHVIDCIATNSFAFVPRSDPLSKYFTITCARYLLAAVKSLKVLTIHLFTTWLLLLLFAAFPSAGIFKTSVDHSPRSESRTRKCTSLVHVERGGRPEDVTLLPDVVIL